MTIEEFDNHNFAAVQYCAYKEQFDLKIKSVDFEEKLIGLDLKISGDKKGTITWVRCENVTILPF